MARKIRSFFTTIKNGFKGIWRNKGSGFLSTGSIGAIMVLVGLILFTVLNVNALVASINESIDELVIYLYDGLEGEDLDDYLDHLSQMDNVQKVTYVSKDQAMRDALDMFEGEEYIIAGLERDNTLPASVEIQIEDLSQADQLIDQLSQLDHVESIRYHREMVDKFVKVDRVVKIAGLIIVLVVLIISIFIISNVIKLGINARRNEIEIMRYIGASRAFIQGPFIMEGVFYSLLGCVLAYVIMYFIYNGFVDSYGLRVLNFANFRLIDFSLVAVDIAIIYLAIGIGIGLIGSLISIRKYLRV